MQKIALLICFLFSMCAIAQPNGDNKIDAAGKKQGYWVKTDPKTSKKIYEGLFKDDKPQGTFKYYYDGTDSVRTKMQFKNDGAIAYSTMYHWNGKLQAKGKYVNEQKDSTWNYYDELGILISSETYVGGKVNGKSFVYYPNGVVSDEKNFKMGVQDGPFKQYYDNKAVKAEGSYQNGALFGKNMFYYPNGTAASQGIYDKGGIRKGVWLYKTKEGKIESKEVWVNGKQLNDKQMEEYFKKNKSPLSESNSGNEFEKKNTGTKPTNKPKAAGKK